jgi:hypothetical protein
MAILTREQILQASDLQRETVAVPEWGGEVVVRSMTGNERDQYEAGMIELRQSGKKTSYSVRLEKARARLCSLTICDESGQRLFSEADMDSLGGKNASALDRVFDVAKRLSGLRESDVEELAKN